MRTDSEIHHLGIFGRRLSGKTTLAIRFLAGSYAREGRLAAVLDPKKGQHTWGAHCWVTNDREEWLRRWQLPTCRNCNLVWEETSTTCQRDPKLVDVFTAKAGAGGHRLVVTGHSGASMLPVMREQLTELFLFRQSRREAEMWAEQFAEDGLLDACTLNPDRREFMHVRMGRPPKIFPPRA